VPGRSLFAILIHRRPIIKTTTLIIQIIFELKNKDEGGTSTRFNNLEGFIIVLKCDAELINNFN
jgi:hypothetical protein